MFALNFIMISPSSKPHRHDTSHHDLTQERYKAEHGALTQNRCTNYEAISKTVATDRRGMPFWERHNNPVETVAGIETNKPID